MQHGGRVQDLALFVCRVSFLAVVKPGDTGNGWQLHQIPALHRRDAGHLRQFLWESPAHLETSRELEGDVVSALFPNACSSWLASPCSLQLLCRSSCCWYFIFFTMLRPPRELNSRADAARVGLGAESCASL